MKDINLVTAKMESLFQGLQNGFGGKLSSDEREYFLELETPISKGKIEGMTFNDGISYVQFDITFTESITFHINSPKTAPMLFAYCSQGHLTHRFDNSPEMNTLSKFETAILSTSGSNENELHFDKDVAVKVLLIMVDVTTNTTADSVQFNKILTETFAETLKINDNFIHIGSHNFKIAEKIEQLNAITQTGIVRNLLKEGIFRIILALEIEQHANLKAYSPSFETNALNLKEIEMVKELADQIREQPDNNYTIKYLCQKVGLSPFKLQEGFKMIYDRTVNDFITNIRIEKAENLILNSDMNISEIVYSIGFSSRSYFSKIFKEKYNCSPKDYKYSQNSLAITA